MVARAIDLASDVLPTPGGARKCQDGALRLPYQRAHREEFQDPLFDLLERVVVLIENPFSPAQVATLTRLLEPGHPDQPVKVISRDRCFGRHRWHGVKAFELLNGLFFDVLRHLRVVDLLSQVVGFVSAVFLAAQLFVNRLHLLVQVVLLLGFLHLLLDARLNAAVNLELVYLVFENAYDPDQSLERRNNLEQILFFLDADNEVGRDRVCQLARIIDPYRSDHGVVLQTIRQFHVLLEEGNHPTHRALDVAGGLAPL